eukprot:13900207-Heterocapsa_arctica.AAC.1
MIYRWKWDNEKTDKDRAKYGRDGCTRWYPGQKFVKPWTFGVDEDPGLAGFIENHKEIFKRDDDARNKRFQNSMIGLMADDIESSE